MGTKVSPEQTCITCFASLMQYLYFSFLSSFEFIVNALGIILEDMIEDMYKWITLTFIYNPFFRLSMLSSFSVNLNILRFWQKVSMNYLWKTNAFLVLVFLVRKTLWLCTWIKDNVEAVILGWMYYSLISLYEQFKENAR